MPRFNRFALSMQADNLWRAFHGAEHENDAAVLFQMGDRFNSAPSQIQVGHSLFVENAEGCAVFWRTINMSVRREGSAGHKKHFLRGKPALQFLVDSGVDFAHKAEE